MPTVGEQLEGPLEISSLVLVSFPQEAAPYQLGKRVGPSLFPNHKDDTSWEE